MATGIIKYIQFGATEAASVPLIVSGTSYSLDTSNFDGNLSSADDNPQKAFETLDELDWYSLLNKPTTFPPDPHTHTVSGLSIDTSNFSKILSSADDTIQEALDTLDDHIHEASEITVVASGFTQNLSSSDTDVQTALETIDQLVIASDWNDITNKPTEFPPEDHTHVASGITTDTSGFNNNLSSSDDTVQKALDTLDDLILIASGVSWNDIVNKPDLVEGSLEDEYFITDGVADTYVLSQVVRAEENIIVTVNGLTQIPDLDYTIDDPYDLIFGSVLASGQYVHVRHLGVGVVTSGISVVADWDDITNKPTEFTPEAHTHTASEIIVTSSGFSQNLSSSDTDVQTALETIDQLVIASEGVDESVFNKALVSGYYDTTQKIFNKIDQDLPITVSGLCPTDGTVNLLKEDGTEIAIPDNCVWYVEMKGVGIENSSPFGTAYSHMGALISYSGFATWISEPEALLNRNTVGVASTANLEMEIDSGTTLRIKATIVSVGNPMEFKAKIYITEITY